MSKIKEHIVINDDLAVTHCNDGWWLYCKSRGQNIAMRATTKEDALIEGLISTLEYNQMILEDRSYQRKVLDKIADIMNDYRSED